MNTEVETPAPEAYVVHLARRGFRLENQLGIGAFGSVWKAIQESFERPVAVKFYDSPYARSEDNKKRFDRESQLIAQVRHPCIPFMLTKGVIKSSPNLIPYHIMEFIDGETLEKRLESEKHLPETEACRIMVSVLRALDAVHEVRVVHRDVKPSNVMLTVGGGVYLIDFSIGVSLEYKPGLTRATSQDKPLGTFVYASPEQKKDASTVDHLTDIYSCVVVLLEMLTGHTGPRSARALDNVPGELGGIVRASIEAERERRPQSAGEFARLLGPFADRATLAARSPTLAFCKNPCCGAAVLSDQGYYRGPRIEENSVALYCAACGGEMVRACPGCHRALSSDLGNFIVTRNKGQDRLQANCHSCGAKVFAVPTCQKCGSLLKKDDMNKDTTEGCQKCIVVDAFEEIPEPDFSGFGGNPGDDDIPF